MIYKNGYKVVYEVAADGKRTFYATKSNVYPAADDVELASFIDAEYAGKVVYEYDGAFYVSDKAVPTYNEDGTPADTKIDGFDILFKDQATEGGADTDTEEPETPAEDPVVEPTVEPEDTTEPTDKEEESGDNEVTEE